MDLERKSFKPQIKAVTEEGQFEAVIATLGVRDHDGDVVVAGALAGKTMSIVPSHDWQSVPFLRS